MSKLRYNEPQHNEPFRVMNGCCTPDTVGSGQANLDATKTSVQRKKLSYFYAQSALSIEVYMYPQR